MCRLKNHLPDEMETTTTTTTLESDDEPSRFLTLTDLLAEVWEASFSATRNIRLLIATISSYMARCAKVQCDTRRMREGREMKNTLMGMYSSWVLKGSMASVCPKQEMQSFVRCVAPRELQARLVKGVMIEETFNEWVNEYRRHVGPLEADSAVAAVREDAEEERDDDGLDSLFESIEERGARPIAQNVTRLRNGRLHIVRTPGEMGGQLARVQVYNVADINNVEKRDWWKRATLRAQFLYSSATTDVKCQALRRLLDAVASDLRGVPRVVGETRNLTQAEAARPARLSRKRGRDEDDDEDDAIATASG